MGVLGKIQLFTLPPKAGSSNLAPLLNPSFLNSVVNVQLKKADIVCACKLIKSGVAYNNWQMELAIWRVFGERDIRGKGTSHSFTNKT